MKFSVCLSSGYEGLAYPVDFCEPQDLIRHAQLAEKLGYDSVWGNDHITPPRYVRDHVKGTPNFYDVLITMAVACANAGPTVSGTMRPRAGRCCAMAAIT